MAIAPPVRHRRRPRSFGTAEAAARVLGLSTASGEASSDANYPMSLGIPAIAIGGGGVSVGSHTLDERFDTTNAWTGTQYAVLLTVALSER
ncbi:MAG: hypothetical protein QM736_11735 [Vicinamibacterales bacterium]